MLNKPKETVKEWECKHEYVHVEDDYGGLCDGGSYATYECKKCGQEVIVQLPD